jgi:iron(III) transport system permease protein
MPYIVDALKNTAILLVLVPTGTMLFSAILSWIIVRTRVQGRRALDFLAFLPHTMPSIVVGLAFMWLYLTLDFIPIYGKIWIIALALKTYYLAFGTRTTNGAMFQIHHELEEAASLSGASWFRTFRKITIPLLIPSLVGGWIWIAIHAVRELPIALMLYSPESRILSVLIWDFWESGEVPLTAAIGVVLLIFVATILFLGRLLAQRTAREY